jgi:hypothetical protein
MEDDKYFYSGSGTSFVEFKSIPDFFASSIVQEYIEKEIEYYGMQDLLKKDA